MKKLYKNLSVNNVYIYIIIIIIMILCIQTFYLYILELQLDYDIKDINEILRNRDLKIFSNHFDPYSISPLKSILINKIIILLYKINKIITELFFIYSDFSITFPKYIITIFSVIFLISIHSDKWKRYITTICFRMLEGIYIIFSFIKKKYIKYIKNY